VQRKFWRKTGWIVGVFVGLIILFFAAWTWYAWFGSVPHKYFSIRFEDTDRGYSGMSALVGRDQLIYLHGGTLGRVDLKTKKQIWAQEVITKSQVDELVKVESATEDRMNEGSDYRRRRTGDALERIAKQILQSQLTLHVSGQNIWVGNGEKLTHYDWDNGEVLRNIALSGRGRPPVAAGDELQLPGEQTLTHINLASGETRVESFGDTQGATVVANGNSANTAGGLAGLTSSDGKPLDPASVAAQAQNLNLQGRLALPALIANEQYEAQLEAALRDDSPNARAKISSPAARRGASQGFRVVAGPDGAAQFAVALLEEKFTTRSAMKPAAGKSILDSGNLTTGNEGEAVNQQLNEMQRKNGGDTVTEDESRYRVTVRLPGAADWTGEVTGPPQLFVLKTVNVVAAGKTLNVLDKSNKQLCQAALTYPVPAAGIFLGEQRYGEGPCVERGSSLYVFDQAVLTAFDLSSGNARWRLPSVGVVGFFFDDVGSLYVNTTTGNPDDIRYARQIDINRKNEPMLFKLDPQTGKVLWSTKPCGFVSYLSGKFIYAVDSYDPNPTDEDVMNEMAASLQKPPFLHIQRLNPKNGRVLCEYYDRDRCPVDVRFDANSIQLIFKREVQVLRYLTF
jgi:outer membrane protein assembly factor BamB